MATGTVKWFSNQRGYGFIIPEGGGSDIFVHFSAIQGEGYKTLREGEKVEFEQTKGPKGDQAINVKNLGKEEKEGAKEGEAPKEEKKAEAPKEEKKAEAPKEEKKAEAPKEEKKAEAPKEEKKAEAPKEEKKEG